MNPSRQRITLQEFITKIQNPSDILKAIPSSNDYSEELNSENARTYFLQNSKQKTRLMRQNSHYITNTLNIAHPISPVYSQMATLILITPVKFIANEVFQWCSKLFPFLNQFPQIVSAGLMMRFAESSLILNQVDSTLQTMRWGICRYPFINGAYLYLCAASKNPIEYEIKTLTKYPRVDCMTFYYLGINFLMLKIFLKAQESFLHSLTINSPSDFSKEIASNFFLSCFLNHFDESQARLLISDKIEISEYIIELFTKVDEIELNSDDDFSDIFKFLIDDINKEIKRRRVIRFANATEAIQIDLFVKKANLFDQNELIEILKILKNEKIVSFKIKDDVVCFYQPNLKSVIDCQYESVMKLINELKFLSQKNSVKNYQSNSNAEDDDESFS